MRIPLLFLATTVSLGGCAASIPPVQVTRFHLGQVAPGTVMLEPGVTSLEATTYRSAVTNELRRLGFAEASGGARYRIAVVTDRDIRAAAPRRSPVSIGVGGGTGGFGGGVGGGVSFGLGGNRSTQIVATRMSVRIVESAGGTTIWEGRAETEAPANAPAAQPGLAAEKLARALFKDFPGASGRTISVP